MHFHSRLPLRILSERERSGYYIRLADGKQVQQWNSRGHFFAAAAEAMRRILIEQARRKGGPKAGGHLKRIELSSVDPETSANDLDILALGEALDRVEAKVPRAAQLVKLRFFAGLTIQEAAATLDISVSTVKADWTYAKSWLRAEMFGSPQ